MNQHLERLDGLAPFLRRPALALLESAQRKLALTLLVVHGWRSLRAQWALYQLGRRYDPETGDWFIKDAAALRTKAKPGTSAHNVITRDGQPAALALDVIPLDGQGRPDWETPDLVWDDLYELAWRVGLDPLGDPIGAQLVWDKGHFEEPAWKLKLEGLGLLLPTAEVGRV